MQHPGQNVAAIYALAANEAPFQPMLTAAPNDWTLAVTYTADSLSVPSAVAMDAGGNVWITNRRANTVTELAHSGAVLAPSAPVLSGPATAALDIAGAPWIANATDNTLTHLRIRHRHWQRLWRPHRARWAGDRSARKCMGGELRHSQPVGI